MGLVEKSVRHHESSHKCAVQPEGPKSLQKTDRETWGDYDCVISDLGKKFSNHVATDLQTFSPRVQSPTDSDLNTSPVGGDQISIPRWASLKTFDNLGLNPEWVLTDVVGKTVFPTRWRELVELRVGSQSAMVRLMLNIIISLCHFVQEMDNVPEHVPEHVPEQDRFSESMDTLLGEIVLRLNRLRRRQKDVQTENVIEESVETNVNIR